MKKSSTKFTSYGMLITYANMQRKACFRRWDSNFQFPLKHKTKENSKIVVDILIF